MVTKRILSVLRVAVCCIVCVLPLTRSLASPLTVNFIDSVGKPVVWGTNTVDFPGLSHFDSSITIDPGDSTVNLAGLYLLASHGPSRVPMTPGMAMSGATLNIDASEVTGSLRQAAGMVWNDGKLYVAEYHHDGMTDNCVWVFDSTGKLLDRIPTVSHPRALAIAGGKLFVCGDWSLAAFDLSTHNRLFSVPMTDGASIHEIAATADKLYVGDTTANCVLIVNPHSGAEISRFDPALSDVGGNNAQPVTQPSLTAVGVAVAPTGNLIVSDSSAIREFTADGTFVRKVTDVKGGAYVAVDGAGRIALSRPYSGIFTSDVWIYDKDGKPITRLFRTGWGRNGSFAGVTWNYLAGLTGKILSPGGVAFDPQGNLYVADYNDYVDTVKSEPKYRGYGDHICSDGGVVKVSPTGEILARWGSRYSDGVVIAARLAQRKIRPMMLRTAKAIKGGKSMSLLVLGDSLTQVGGTDWNGGATKTELNWTYRLADLLQQQAPGMKVSLNPQGMGGNLAFDGLSRVAVPEQYPQADLILLEFGTNDAPNEPASKYAESLRQLVKFLQVTTDSDIVILTLHSLDAGNSPVVDPRQDYVTAAIAIGKETRVPVIDMAAGMKAKLAGRPWTTLFLDRGQPFDAHPNDPGHEAYAECVRDGLVAELKSEGALR